MLIPKKRLATRRVAALTAAVLAAPLVSAVASGPASAGTTGNYPRGETLYTSGTAYGQPTNFNPNDPGALYTGTQGLLYEPLFLYDPIHGGYKPWLATKGTWQGNKYVITVRNGVSWVQSPSQSVVGTLSGNDVAFSIELAMKNASDPWNSNVSSVASVSATGNTVTVTFKGTPAYTEWQDYLWNAPVLPAAQWGAMSSADQITGANMTPVSTGPMTLDSTSSTQACYQTNPHWWGAQLGLSFHFKYLCDIVNGSNNVELANLTTGQLDWSNNFLPGISVLVNGLGGTSAYGIHTYYRKAPYMLSANTAWLDMNTTKAPMNNVYFRKAVAAAIDPQKIVTGVYTQIVKAANPTGLLPNLKAFVDNSAVSKYGFSYNESLAKQYLAKSGYKGQKLTLEVPNGWTDWEAAIQNISQQLNAVGIKVTPTYPQYPIRESDLNNGTFDMAIDNNAGPDATPWSYFQRVYNLPVLKTQNATLNWERYKDPTAWALVQKAGATPLSDTKALDAIYSQLEARFLQTLPVIPLWYNGAWFQAQSSVWAGYPSAVNRSDQYTPIMWHGWLGAMTTVYALAQIRRA
ncbi:MAG TPA: ABC transporter substrate-binding protein [Acidimicrobiales bacterium]|nr:ABC transporter substrate-binding protein [Acidimicrobiales bacterium]